MRILRHNNHGFALALSLIFLFLVVSFVGVYILSTSHGLATATKAANLKKAYYLADAGLTDAYIQLRGYGTTPPSSFTTASGYYAVGGGKTGSYSVATASFAIAGTSAKMYTLTSTGTFGGTSKTIVLRVQQTSVSSFAYLSSTEIHPVWGALWWITGMTTVGPVRSNGTLNIWGSPIFDGTVIQSGSGINYWVGAPNHPIFTGGLTVSSPTLPFPTTSMLSTLASQASSGGIALTGNSVVFNANGTINVTNAAKGWSNLNMAIPSNGVIYVTGGTATVKGTVNGRATVGSDTQIYINGNIIYNNDPRAHPTSTDLLGLVSKNDVTVLAAAAPANLELDAVLVALQGSFQVDTWWVTGKGNLIQFGSLVNSYCGPTGVFDPGTGILSGGYNQLQYFDTRLVSNIPPGFPAVSDASGRYVYVKLGFSEY